MYAAERGPCRIWHFTRWKGKEWSWWVFLHAAFHAIHRVLTSTKELPPLPVAAVPHVVLWFIYGIRQAPNTSRVEMSVRDTNLAPWRAGP